MNYPEQEYTDDAQLAKKINMMLGKDDPYLFEMKRKDEKGKPRKIKSYGTGGQGARIRNAIDGRYYNDRVGTIQENNYFSVLIATGECNNRDMRCVLYYNTPEEYERHLFETLDPAMKRLWYERQKSADCVG